MPSAGLPGSEFSSPSPRGFREGAWFQRAGAEVRVTLYRRGRRCKRLVGASFGHAHQGARGKECACVFVSRRRQREEPGLPFSGSSMQAALEVTARHCRKEADAYGQCVAANPSSWHQDCHQLKLQMAKCTSSHPIVQKIRQECAEPFTAFEQCLKQNQSTVANCTEHVQKFLLCADQVKLAT